MTSLDLRPHKVLVPAKFQLAELDATLKLEQFNRSTKSAVILGYAQHMIHSYNERFGSR